MLRPTTKSFFNLCCPAKTFFFTSSTRTSYYENQQGKEISSHFFQKSRKKFNVKVEKILAFDPEYSSDTICISPWRIFFRIPWKKVEFIAYTLFSLSIISLEQKIQFPRKSSGISKSPPKLSRTRDDIKLRLLKNKTCNLNQERRSFYQGTKKVESSARF